MKQFFQQAGFVWELEPIDQAAELKNQPKLQHYLEHCCKAHNFLFLVN